MSDRAKKKAGSGKRALQVGFVFSVVVLAWFSLPVALVAILAMMLVVVFDKLEEIVEFSFGPLKAKLERTVSESETLLEGLRQVAFAQSKVLVSASAYSGRFASKTGWIFHASKDVEKALKAIGASEQELVDARVDLVKLTLRDLGAAATNGNYVPSELGVDAVAEWKEFRSTDKLSNPDFVETWLRNHSVLGPEQAALIDAMRWILEHKDIKDEEQYLLAKQEYKLKKVEGFQ